MDGHLLFLRTACRLCGNVLSKKSDFADKNLFKSEFLSQFQINIDEDMEDIHPNNVCAGCKRSLYRILGNTDVQAKVWASHYEGNCPCNKKARGRPLKRVEEKVAILKDNESDTEEIETEEEKNSCQQFSALIKNISLLDRELALACAKELADQFNLIFDDEVREPLSNKLEYFKAHTSKAKKEALLLLYNDITEELQHLEAVDEHCILEDDEDGEVD